MAKGSGGKRLHDWRQAWGQHNTIVLGVIDVMYKMYSLTPKFVLAGTKNSRLEDFLLAKHTSHKHPHHDEPCSRLAAWFPWMNNPPPGASTEGVGQGHH